MLRSLVDSLHVEGENWQTLQSLPDDFYRRNAPVRQLGAFVRAGDTLVAPRLRQPSPTSTHEPHPAQDELAHLLKVASRLDIHDVAGAMTLLANGGAPK